MMQDIQEKAPPVSGARAGAPAGMDAAGLAGITLVDALRAEDDCRSSTHAVGLLLILAVQAIVWLGVGIGLGYWLAK